MSYSKSSIQALSEIGFRAIDPESRRQRGPPDDPRGLGLRIKEAGFLTFMLAFSVWFDSGYAHQSAAATGSPRDL